MRTVVALCALASTADAFSVQPVSRNVPVSHVARSRQALCASLDQLKKPMTVGDAKEAFQATYGRPVDGLLQSFVLEMLTGGQIALINPNYQESPVFSVGFESLCDVFMAENDAKDDLRKAILFGLGFDEAKVAEEAAALKAAASGKSEADLLAMPELKAIADKPNFKYSYQLGAGLIALMPLVGETPSKEVIARWSEALGLPTKSLTKDWEFFEDASKRMLEGKQMMLELKAASKRKQAAKLKEEAEKAAKEADEASETA